MEKAGNLAGSQRRPSNALSSGEDRLDSAAKTLYFREPINKQETEVATLRKKVFELT